MTTDHDELAMTEEALRATERERLRALREGDMPAAERLHAGDYQLISPSGATLSKRDYLDGIASGIFHYAAFEPMSPIQARVSEHMAAVRYQCHIEVRFTDGSSDSGIFWHTDIYERRDGQWQAVWSQATRIAPGD